MSQNTEDITLPAEETHLVFNYRILSTVLTTLMFLVYGEGPEFHTLLQMAPKKFPLIDETRYLFSKVFFDQQSTDATSI